MSETARDESVCYNVISNLLLEKINLKIALFISWLRDQGEGIVCMDCKYGGNNSNF